MKIVIIGAGLGGVASALALTRSGHQVELYEQADELRKGGYGVILWPNATGILSQLGIDHTDLGHRLDRVDITSETGQPLVKVDLDRIARDFGSPNKVIRRSELVEVLAAALPPGVLRFGARATAIDEPAPGTDGPVAITFEDGRRIEADVLIGADGHRSFVRKHLFGFSPAEHTGWATWHGTTPLPVELTNSNRVQTMAGEHGLCVMHPLGESMLYWAFETPWADGDAVPPGAPGSPDGTGPLGADGEPQSAVANLRARFAGFSSPLPELLESISDEDVQVFPHILHQVPKVWGRGPVTLLGDSVHAVPPRTGMGANQALEDAWVIGRALSGQGSPAELLRRYEKIRRRRVKMLYHYAAATGKQGQSVPGLFKRSKDGISFTGFQRFQIKAFSNYLNAKPR
ncbi:FAD-dependent oxidoreductase [Kitasatospora sp. NPDC057512]|uniref:FAD-dependent oxidoreductase n=1 Tax=Kitasatospora sp. NPDC057512 TaxID=3346154 RepID=UPI0036A02AEF